MTEAGEARRRAGGFLISFTNFSFFRERAGGRATFRTEFPFFGPAFPGVERLAGEGLLRGTACRSFLPAPRRRSSSDS